MADPVAVIEDYLQWKAEWGQASKDFSPSNYAVQRAKEQALETLIRIADLLKDKTWDDPLLDDIAKLVEGD